MERLDRPSGKGTVSPFAGLILYITYIPAWLLDTLRDSRISYLMKTVIETETFKKHADKEWTIDERLEFVSWIASNSKAGDVIPGADGVRKVRWSAKGTGKRGGVRVIYYNVDQAVSYTHLTLPTKA